MSTEPRFLLIASPIREGGNDETFKCIKILQASSDDKILETDIIHSKWGTPTDIITSLMSNKYVKHYPNLVIIDFSQDFPKNVYAKFGDFSEFLPDFDILDIATSSNDKQDTDAYYDIEEVDGNMLHSDIEEDNATLLEVI